MRAFRFRAQAALDLRKREFDEACRELADAERVREVARAVMERATAAVDEARVSGRVRAQRPGTITDWHWYRIWILRLEHERTTALAVLGQQDAVVDRRRVARDQAQQRYESLDRFREKALEKVAGEEREEERKLLDELATRRFLSEARRAEGVAQ